MKGIRGTFLIALFLVALGSSPAEPKPSSYADQVTIRRDTYGVPHILGKTEEAAAFGLGYAQAEDHAVEIARRLVSARGESAKYFGRNPDIDFLLRQFDNYQVCRAHFRDLDPLMQRIYKAYIAGVNLFIEQNRGRLPDWIPVLNEIDVMAYIRQGAVTSVRGVIRNLRAKYEQQTSSYPDDDEGFDDTGSNAFALGPSRTTSGNTILLGNPHLSWSSLYWEAHVTVPGRLNFFGSTLPGYPVLRAGFNEKLGWVTTNNAPDMADVFSLQLDPKRPDHYVFEGKSRPVRKRAVTVEIQNSDGSIKTEIRTFEDSHLGIIIYRTKDRVFAYRSTQLESFRHFEGFYRQAETLFAAGYHNPAASLAGAVLEDTLRKLGQKHGVPFPASTKINSLNAELYRANVYNKLVHIQVTAFADIRNNADHGHFDKYKIRDVEDMVKWVRDFAADYLK